MRGLISGLGRRDSLFLSLSLFPAFSLSLSLFRFGSAPFPALAVVQGEVFIWGMMTEVGSR